MIPARNSPPMIAEANYGSIGQQSHFGGSQSTLGGNMQRFGDEEIEISENYEAISGDGNEQDTNQRPKKKSYHRHTQHQINELEAFYRETPHPDDRQRRDLGEALGLEPLQIKFWFQNKRTQMKTKNERDANKMLNLENDRLLAENQRFKEALSSAACPNCGGPASLGEMSFDEHQLRIENAHLREEIKRICGMTAKYTGKSIASHPLFNASIFSRSLLDQQGIGRGAFGPGELLKTITGAPDIERPLIVKLAVDAMLELLIMAQHGEPLWFSVLDTNNGSLLNEDEYARVFPSTIGSRPIGWKTEATRETGMVMMNPLGIVEILMDVNQWSAVFSTIVSRAVTMDVLSTGVAGNYDGSLQVMLSDFHVPSPLVPTREALFVRYCKQNLDGTWVVVDASLDSLSSTSNTRCRRRPSGCLIQELPNGHSKVIWVEHVEVDNQHVHALYKALVSSGLAFGARRWVATLGQQCERLASSVSHQFSNNDIGGLSDEGRKNLLKLAERMVISFCGGVTGSSSNHWSNLSQASMGDVKVTTMKCVNDLGKPFSAVINATTSMCFPIKPRRLFDFLRNQASRSEWDILSSKAVVHEVVHISNGSEQANCVSLLSVDMGQKKSGMFILQESCFDATGSYVIYAPIDVNAMNVVLNGGDTEYVSLLPSGFAVLPDGPSGGQDGEVGELGSGKSLLTISFQILVDLPEKPDFAFHHINMVNNLIVCTTDRIKESLLGEDSVQ